MKSIHVLRKPCSESTVAANVLRYGTGALDIDGTRVGFASEADEAESKTKNQHADFGSAPVTGNVPYGDYSMMVDPKNYNPPGRWPANLVLQHLDGCVQDGTKKVRPGNGSGRTGAGANGFRTAYVGGERKSAGFTGSFVDDDGTETVAAWNCAPGCPVARLDEQSGIVPAKNARTGLRGGSAWHGASGFGSPDKVGTWPADSGGGASRFFKQVKP